jgi:glycosyltransferase involved in cell wall biosynthesis
MENALMKPIKILFDASFIFAQDNNSKKGNRTGIFWVTYNILLQFKQSPLYKITLYTTQKSRFYKKNECKHFLTSFPCIYLPDEKRLLKNIEIHKEKINKTKNIFIISLRFLKILKNVCYLHLIKIKRATLSKASSKFDIFFSPFSPMPGIIKEKSSMVSFNILYDCIPILEKSYDPLSMDFFQEIIQNLNKETYYFCISECTRKDFLRIAPAQLDERKVFVTPIATSQIFSPNYNKTILLKALKKYGITQKTNDFFIFSLCNIDPRKNLIFTIKCFIKFIEKHKIDNLYFYLGGGHFQTYIDKFRQEISDFSDYQDKIILLGYIDDEDVNILYSNSLFFTFLSQYEGFGLPPLEAMQAGTPVICSNNSSLPEVVGDAAITITYNDEAACIKAFEDLYFNGDLRKHYIEKGLERAKLFSWEKTFNLMSEVIAKVLNE